MLYTPRIIAGLPILKPILFIKTHILYRLNLQKNLKISLKIVAAIGANDIFSVKCR